MPLSRGGRQRTENAKPAGRDRNIGKRREAAFRLFETAQSFGAKRRKAFYSSDFSENFRKFQVHSKDF
jgi:hypothetical protein